jgi:TPR repeat protein
MKPLVHSFVVASIALGAAAAQKGETIAVLELRSRVHPIAAAELSDRVLEAVRRAAPEARIVDREDDADFVVSGKVSRGGLGYRAWLELRDRSGDLVQRASATATTRRELAEAIEGAAGDLLRSRHEALAASPLTISPAPLPEVPAPAGPPPEDGALNLDANAHVLVAWDRARRVEAYGKENPEEAAEAWRRLAGMRGQNPFREIAATRAQQWDAFAAGKRAAEAQLARDTARLRKVLPLASFADSAKIELLVRFAGAYGFDKVSPLVALLPSAGLRARAELSLDCEVKEAHACLQLARAADEANDPKAAVEYLDRACATGAPAACSQAADRLLQGEARDPARAVAALQRGCDSSSAAACVRLARIHEEGDGVPANAKLAAEARENACSAGDGKSCRRLAGMSDEAGRIADLLRKGCDGGDSVSCALAAREPAMVQRQLQEAAAAARKDAPPVATPARATEKAPDQPSAPAPRTEGTPRRGRGGTAAGLIVFGALAGAGALMLALDDPGPRTTYRGGRNLVTEATPQSNSVRTVLTVVMGGAAVISTGAGLAVLFSKPAKPDAPSVGVGVSPAGVVVSGTFR